MKKINIQHIEKHLFDKTKHGWDRNNYPLYNRINITEVKIIRMLNAKLHKKVHGVLQ